MKFLKIAGIALLVVGSVAANFTDVLIASYVSVAVAALGLALTIVGVWKESEKKSWKEILSLILFAVGGFLCGFSGFTEGTVTQIITAVFGAVALITGLITAFIKPKEEQKEVKK